MRFLLLALTLVAPSQSFAQPAASGLESAVDELDSILADLEAQQMQTRLLRADLGSLQALSQEQQRALAEQESVLLAYRASVVALEEHDRASLALAVELRGQLTAEKQLTSWLLPVALVALGVAIVEAGLLLK